MLSTVSLRLHTAVSSTLYSTATFNFDLLTQKSEEFVSIPTFIRPPEASVLPVTFSLFFRRAFSEIPRPIALKLCHMIWIWLYFINWLQKFGECSRKKFGGQKHAKFRSILDHFRLWPRISPERGNISKLGKTYELGKFLLRLTKKVR